MDTKALVYWKDANKQAKYGSIREVVTKKKEGRREGRQVGRQVDR